MVGKMNVLDKVAKYDASKKCAWKYGEHLRNVSDMKELFKFRWYRFLAEFLEIFLAILWNKRLLEWRIAHLEKLLRDKQ